MKGRIAELIGLVAGCLGAFYGAWKVVTKWLDSDDNE